VEAVIDGYNGLSVNGFDPQEIACAVIRLLSDPALYEDLAANGLTYAQRSGFEKCAALFEDLCESLVAGA
jgi:glycosyltransferase involved in cell wall biosynthesis